MLFQQYKRESHNKREENRIIGIPENLKVAIHERKKYSFLAQNFDLFILVVSGKIKCKHLFVIF